ncbi:MAG: cytochrome c, partial [Gammaproteobacteria bacterium]|nr:cytochrome c [Gammaproteobacteria bacterium]
MAAKRFDAIAGRGRGSAILFLIARVPSLPRFRRDGPAAPQERVVNKAVVALLAAIGLASSGAFGRDSAMPTGDAAAGRSKAAECAACHGAGGGSINGQWPNLAGQKYAYLVQQLKAFQDGSRSSPVMTPIARQLSAAAIDDLAAYFSDLKGAPPVRSPQIA